jgi:hypothetical protein
MSTTAPLPATLPHGPEQDSEAIRSRRSYRTVLHRPQRRTRRERYESLATFVLAAGAAFALGYHVLTVNRVIEFDGVDRLMRAFMVLWDAPPKLAAIGFTDPPIPSLLMIPFTVIKPLASSLVALPLFSALFFGATIALLGRLLRRCALPLPARIALLVLFAINPMWAFHGSNGAPDIVYLFFLTVVLYSFVCWYDSQSTIYLIGAGFAMAMCMLTRYGFIGLAVLLAFLFGAAMWRRGAADDEVEGSVITYLAPVVYAFGLWTLLNGVIIGSPLHWLSSPSPTLSINSDQVATTSHYSVALVASHMMRVVVAVGPMALVALPLLVLGFVGKRDRLCLWLAGFLAFTVLLIGGAALRVQELSTVSLEGGMAVQLVAFVALARVYTISGPFRSSVFAVMLASAVVALPLAWHGMLTYPFQDMDQAFINALRSPGKNLTGTGSRGGYTVGVQSEQEMAAYIKHVVGNRKHSVLTDNAQTYAVMMLTGRPSVFVDRSQRGDGPWKEILNSPAGHVRYMLIAAQAPGDLIRTRYPSAATGGTPGLTPVFSTQRYVLVAVAPRARATSRTSPSSSRTGT